MDNQQERRDASVYLAAMIQGEGSVMCYRNHNGGRNRNSSSVNARIVIYNTDPHVLDAVQRYFVVLNVGAYRYHATRRDHGWQRKDLGTIMVNGFKRLTTLLPCVIPFLVGAKQRQAKDLYRLSAARSQVHCKVPYEPWMNEIVDTLCPGKKRLESSETNTSDAAHEAAKRESGPLAKASGGESVSEYPALCRAAS